MERQVLAGNQDVVQVCVVERKAAKSLVHEALEGLGSILQTKRLTGEFKQPKRYGYGHLGYVCWLHMIWWYAITRSILLKIVAPCREGMKSCRPGTGYWSGTVVAFRAR